MAYAEPEVLAPINAPVTYKDEVVLGADENLPDFNADVADTGVGDLLNNNENLQYTNNAQYNYDYANNNNTDGVEGDVNYISNITSYKEPIVGQTTSSYHYAASYQLPPITTESPNYASYNAAGAAYV